MVDSEFIAESTGGDPLSTVAADVGSEQCNSAWLDALAYRCVLTAAPDPLDGGGERSGFGRSHEEQPVGDACEGECRCAGEEPSDVHDQVIGETVGDALKTVTAFQEMISSRGTIAGDEELIGDGVAFAGVAKYPARVKCALLGWMAFKDALAQASGEKHALAQASGEKHAPANTKERSE